MAYTVLARRYRSTTFDEVVGQEHIAQTLKRAIESGRIAHAYLFCGTRGTGKTSTARILAKALNCQSSDKPVTVPCNQCESCLGIARGDDIDVIEIDAASNTGVDNVRELIENSQYRPSRSRFKIYIIDEAHMLSKAAFNALLKTLEEPPEHVKFILATTEPEKLLPTILSRCQRYDFRNIPTREIAGHLKEICAKEQIAADEDALLLVAKAGAGSMRDSLSLLDRLLSMGEKHLTVGMIEQLLGLPKAQLIFDLAAAIGSGDVKTVLTSADAMVQGGLSVDQLLASLVEHLRNLLILRACGPDCGLVEVPGTAIKDLTAQAAQFDAAVLTQDIAVLEELRRQIRQSQAGRALLDAALVRLSLADQFSSVAELLAQVGGAPARATARPATPQKKTTERGGDGSGFRVQEDAGTGGVSGAGGSSVEAARANVAAAFSPSSGTPGEGRGGGSREAAAPVNSSPAAPNPHPNPPPDYRRREEEGTTAPPPASTVSLDLDEDDDLPRPGKVWDSSGPSLSELLKQQSKAPPPSPSPDANVEPVDVLNLSATWKTLLALVATKGPSLQALLQSGRFIGIEDGTAIIRYPKGNEHFIKLIERTGKKEMVRDALHEVLKQPVGVKFEVDTEAAPPPPAAGSVGAEADRAGSSASSNGSPRPAAAPPATRPPPRPHAEPPARPPEPVVPSIRLTPELRGELEADPLIKTILEELGGSIVKVE